MADRLSDEALGRLVRHLNSAHYYITREEIRAALRGDYEKPLPAPPIPPMSNFLNRLEETQRLDEKLQSLKILFQGASHHPAIDALIDECCKALHVFEAEF